MSTAEDPLRILNRFAVARRNLGDDSLVLQPVSESQEQFAPPDEFDSSVEQGLVLEPREGASFEIGDIAPRQRSARIHAFCDGIRSTYFIGYEIDHNGTFPILYTCNSAAIRTRETATGYHRSLHHVQRDQSTLLAPFRLFRPAIHEAYKRLSLYTTPLADVSWTSQSSDEVGLSPVELEAMGGQAWKGRALRRARYLLDLTEQITALTGIRIMREQDSMALNWLLKDGSLFQFEKRYLQHPELLQNIVCCVKSHPVPFFGASGESTLAKLAVGQRSVAFLPRPIREARRGISLADTTRPMVSWYLRVRKPDPHSANNLSGVIRLDIAKMDDWRDWVDDVSWAVLDEFYGLSSLPDPRYDVMPYGIYDCEQFLKAQQLPGKLLLAALD